MAGKKENQVPNNVTPIVTQKCSADNCKSKPTRAGFCDHHYEWFKMGLITKEGHPAKDFDKKYQQYMLSKKVA